MSTISSARFTPARVERRVVDHLIERDGERRLVAREEVAERVADEHRVHAALVDEPCRTARRTP